jgi:hypothetical protein
MNHNITLAIVAIVAAMSLTAAAFAIPQQALASRHHNQNNNHSGNSVKVDQQINQLNNCTGVPPQTPSMMPAPWSTDSGGSGVSSGNSGSSGSISTFCLNLGENSAHIHK